MAWLIVLMVLEGGIVLYAHWPALTAHTVSFDDQQYLTANYVVQNPSWTSARRFLCEVLEPSTVKGYYQPLAMISLMLDSAMGGSPTNLRPFHRTSLSLHVANTLLITVLLYALFRHPLTAVIVGLLFGVHPLTIEPIPWIGERKTVLATFFALWSIIAYLYYTRLPTRGGLYVASLALFVLALMSKPTTTPLPLLLLLLDIWPLKRIGRRALMEKLPFLAVAAVFACITFISQARTAAVTMPGQYGPWRISLILCHNIVFYLWKMIWPAGLSSHYPFPKPFDLSHPMLLVGVLGTCLLMAVLFLSLRWTRALAIGWIFFFVAIFPAMGVIGFTNVIASDKYAYLPMVGFLLPLTCFLTGLWEQLSNNSGKRLWKSCVIGLAGCLIIVEIIATRHHLARWQNTVALYEYMLKLAPDAAPLHVNLGMALEEQGRTAEAIEHYRRALTIEPDWPYALGNLGKLLDGQGQTDEAITLQLRALQIDPNLPEAYNNLGLSLVHKGRYAEAVERFRKALHLRREFPQAHNNYGMTLLDLNRTEEAINHFNEALRLFPDFVGARNNLGIVFARQGRLTEAATQFEHALHIQPDQPAVHNNLGNVLTDLGRFDQAIGHYQEALRLKPDYRDARNNLSDALARQGKLASQPLR